MHVVVGSATHVTLPDIIVDTHNIVTTHSAQTSYSPHYRQIREGTSDTKLTRGNNKNSYKDTHICI
jgi:hypothetical protein